MTEIIKVYEQKVPALRFVGIRYGDEDRDFSGSYALKWQEWFQTGRFGILEKAAGMNLGEIYPDGDAYIGLMRYQKGEPFQYWIGMFLPEKTAVPEGFSAVDFPESRLGVCWIQGPADEVYGLEDVCADRLEQEKMAVNRDQDGAWWFFERYGCPRFTEADEQGRVILDICHYLV